MLPKAAGPREGLAGGRKPKKNLSETSSVSECKNTCSKFNFCQVGLECSAGG